MAYMKDARGSRLDSFDPIRDLPPVVAWYNFAELTGADAATVRKVTDKSGLGHDLIQPNASSTPAKATGGDGKPVLRFAAGKFMTAPNLGAVWPIGSTLVPPVTIVSVVKPTVTQADTFPCVVGGLTAGGQARTVIQTVTGCAFASGNALGSSVGGPMVTDDGWHVLISTIDQSSASQYVDGYLTGTGITTVGEGIKALAVGAASASAARFSGDMREVMVINGRLTFEQVEQLTGWLRARSPGVAVSGLANTGVAWEDTTSSNGQAVRIFEPTTPSTPKTVLLWSHPSSQNQFISPSVWAYPLFHAALAQGWYVAASNMHGENWGNQTGLDDLLDLYNLMNGRYAPTKVVLVGASMGGLATASAISKNTIPKAVGAYFIDAVVNLADQYTNASYTALIKTAYGIASDGSDYAAKTAGFDPYLATTSTFNKRLRFTASTTDTLVLKANQTDLMRTKVAGTAVESGLTTHLGGHLAGAAANPTDLVDFVKRCIA